jgi:hypothetical protein
MDKTTRTKTEDGYAYQLPDEAVKALEGQLKQFEKFFGRKPVEGEPIFFDPEHPEKPTPMDPKKIIKRTIEVMKMANVPSEYIYAYEKTDGLMVTEMNQPLISQEDRKLWSDAIAEYNRFN